MPRRTQRLSDKILVAFHRACDQGDFEVAQRLLKVLETTLAIPRTIDHAEDAERDVGAAPGLAGRARRKQETLIAAYERLWQLRHPNAGAEL